MGVLLLMMKASPGRADAQAQGLVGSWVSNIGGTAVTMTLNADGSADLMGTRGSWQASGGQILVAGPQGQIMGAVQGDTLVFVYNGQQFVWTRAGRAPAPGAPAAPAPLGPSSPTGAPFKPEKVLPGERVTPPGTPMSFTMPKNWTGAWTQLGGTPVYGLVAPGLQGKAMLGVSGRVLGPERNQPVATLLRQGAIALWGQGAAGTPLLSETFTVGGHAAGRVIYRATVPHPATGQMVEVEGYLGTVLIDDWAFGFAGLYEVASAGTLRAGLDTMLASLDGKPPARNRQLEQQVAGCWESGTGTSPSTRSKGSAFTSAYIRIAPNGTYSRSGGVSVRTPDLDPNKPERAEGSVSGEFGEQGTFMIHGSLITWIPAGGGGSYANLVEWKPGGLTLDKKLWITCI